MRNDTGVPRRLENHESALYVREDRENKSKFVRLRRKKCGVRLALQVFLASGVSSNYIFKLSSVATRAVFGSLLNENCDSHRVV